MATIGETLLAVQAEQQQEQQPQLSIVELRRRRDVERRGIERNLADSNKALQRHQPGSPMHQMVLSDRAEKLDQLARLDRMTDDDLRQKYGQQADHAATEAARRQMNTPQAQQARKEQIWRSVSEDSARRAALDQVEIEVAQARREAADAAEAQVRERYATEHNAG
jgi:hypothetical protein